MHTQSRKQLLAACIALALGTTGGMAAAESQTFTDNRQETQIWTTYALNPHLRANDLKVSVLNGKATLTGNVAEEVNKDLAKEIALGVSGIDSVDNQIVVKPDYVPPKAGKDRSYGVMVDDATITASVKSKLLWSKQADGMTTQVKTQSGKVTLTGNADSQADKDLAGRLAMNTDGVMLVDNQLVVDASKPAPVDSAKSTAKETGGDIADSWITTKVKSTLMYSSNVNGSDISVSTNSGIVTLSGLVDNDAERDRAIELAQNVRGVKSVRSTELRY
ncbi:BON domain-containing protein [Pseudomonas sp. DY-1]|uniref:BON domain-containing protein n=1 Tax=Pseudomonas sp. DY-1 TaxID=1755504 RepID=UPI000EA9955B|nr:BON domain-containing protein [Pseudomonas sp. DY-1]AYF90022.1 BON domain-containing protein [Pseudomonas sp. DY-1]